MYKELIKQNSSLALSGSYALKLQGFNLRREPKDIDIFSATSEMLKCENGLSFVDGDANLPPSAAMDEVDRNTYSLNGEQLDLFFCNNSTKNAAIIANLITVDGIKCVHWKDILSFKMHYAFDDSESAEKHRDDLVYFFQNNIKVSLPVTVDDLPWYFKS